MFHIFLESFEAAKQAPADSDSSPPDAGTLKYFTSLAFKISPLVLIFIANPACSNNFFARFIDPMFYPF